MIHVMHERENLNSIYNAAYKNCIRNKNKIVQQQVLSALSVLQILVLFLVQLKLNLFHVFKCFIYKETLCACIKITNPCRKWRSFHLNILHFDFWLFNMIWTKPNNTVHSVYKLATVCTPLYSWSIPGLIRG